MSNKDLKERLEHPDEEVRRLAVIELQPSGGKEALELLLAALGDESWRVRKVAVEQILAFDVDENLLQGLVHGIREEENAGMRNSAAEVLSRIGKPAVDTMLKLLDDPDNDVRKFAVDVLGEICSPEGLAGIVRALEDDDENVRVAAAEALGRSGWQGASGPLLDTLGRGDVMLKATVLDSLYRIGARVSCSVIEPLLDDPILRRPALLALGGSSEEEAVDLVLRYLSDRRKGSREAAIVALAGIVTRLAQGNVPSVLEKLRRDVTDKDMEGLEAAVVRGDRDTRVAAARLLGAIGRPKSSPSLVRAASDEAVRREALRALKDIGERAVPSLMEALPELSPEEQILAFEVLATLGDERVLPALTAALDESDDRIKEAAAEALGTLGDKKGIPALAKLLAYEEPDVKRAAVGALSSLARLHPDEVRKAGVTAYESAVSADQRKAALDVLAAVPGGGDEEVMMAAVHDDEPGVRISALKGLKNLHKDRASGRLFSALTAALTDENPDVRASAADCLGELDDKRAVKPLLSMLHDDNVLAKVAAIKALGNIGDPMCSTALRGMLKDKVGLVAVAAIEALARVAPDEFLEELDTCLSNSDPEVLKEVARALRDIPMRKAEDGLVMLLEQGSWEVRSEAANALADRGAVEKAGVLEEMLKREQDDYVRAVLRSAIEKLGHGNA